MAYKVIERFDDNKASPVVRYEAGEDFPKNGFELPSDERIATLLGDNAYKRPFIEVIEEEALPVEEVQETTEEVIEEETPTPKKRGK